MNELQIISAESRRLGLSDEERRQRIFNYFQSQGPFRVHRSLPSHSSSVRSHTPYGLRSPSPSDHGQPVDHQQSVRTQRNVPPTHDTRSINNLESRDAGPNQPTRQASSPSSAGKMPLSSTEKQRSKLVRTPGRVTRSKVNVSTHFIQLDSSGRKAVEMASPSAFVSSSSIEPTETPNTSNLAPNSTLKRKRNIDDDAAAQTKRTRCQTPSTISCIGSDCPHSNHLNTESCDGAQSHLVSWLADQEQEPFEPLDTGIADYALESCRSVEQSIATTTTKTPQSTWTEQTPEHMSEHDQNCDGTESGFSSGWTDVPADDSAFFECKRVQATTDTSIQQYSKVASRKPCSPTDTMSKSTKSSGVHKNRKIAKTLENKISLLAAFREIDAYCEKINLNIDVANKTRLIYHQIHGEAYFKDQPLDALVASCTLVAAETLNVSKQQLQKIVSLFDGPPMCVYVFKEEIEHRYPHIKEIGTVTGKASSHIESKTSGLNGVKNYSY